MKKLTLVFAMLAGCSGEASPGATSAAVSASAVASSSASAASPSASASATAENPKKAEIRAKLFATATAQAFLAAIKGKDSELGITDLQAVTEDSDPNKLLGRPGQYTHKFTWKARGEDGTIEVFPTVEAAKARAEYVRKIGESSPMLLQYVYLNEPRMTVLRVGHKLKPSEAKAWEDITASLSSAGDGLPKP
jgi:hypothetical protein